MPRKQPKKDEPEPEAVWAIVDLMGHKRMAGRLSEVERYGSKLARLDIPTGDGFITKLFGAAAVYEIAFVTEAVARHAATLTTFAPVHPWDFPAAVLRIEPHPEEKPAGQPEDYVAADDDREARDDDGVPF